MSGTQYARPHTLRMDQRDRELLIAAIHAAIERTNDWVNMPDVQAVRREALDRYRSMLEKLCD